LTRVIKEGASLEGIEMMRELMINGERRSVWWTVNVNVLMIDGSRHALFSIMDITAMKQTQLSLIKAKQDAEAATRAKSTFLSNMTHEIRTPMNAILGFGTLLNETPLDVKQKEFVRTIVSSGRQLLDTIEDILDLSKVLSGQLTLEMTSFDLGETVTHFVQTIESQVNVPHVRVITDLDPDAGGNFLGDPVKLGQILSSLLGNAAKFTSKGEIVLTVRKGAIDGQKHQFLFSVRDTGIGITEDKLKVIFDPFVQGDMSMSRKYEGAGLGLSISKFMVEAMGGDLKVRSKLGEGSEFYFSIWFSKVDVTQLTKVNPKQSGQPDPSLKDKMKK
jgi:signal transduction histidine kinase